MKKSLNRADTVGDAETESSRVLTGAEAESGQVLRDAETESSLVLTGAEAESGQVLAGAVAESSRVLASAVYKSSPILAGAVTNWPVSGCLFLWHITEKLYLLQKSKICCSIHAVIFS